MAPTMRFVGSPIETCSPRSRDFCSNAAGSLPYSLEDLNPFAQVDGPTWLWKRRLNTVLLREELQQLNVDADRIVILDVGQDSLIQKASNLLMKHGLLDEEIMVDDQELPPLRDGLRRRQIIDKMVVLLNLDYDHAANLVESCTYIIGGTGVSRTSSTNMVSTLLVQD